uniref:Uncharacterized protein n=1 Tax=Parascaris univalens TaxID=6257 RepID=A0A915APC3_PARUN
MSICSRCFASHRPSRRHIANHLTLISSNPTSYRSILFFSTHPLLLLKHFLKEKEMFTLLLNSDPRRFLDLSSIKPSRCSTEIHSTVSCVNLRRKQLNHRNTSSDCHTKKELGRRIHKIPLLKRKLYSEEGAERGCRSDRSNDFENIKDHS